jgi:hypothetical protein
MDEQKKQNFILQCQNRWNFDSTNLNFYVFEVIRYQNENQKVITTLEEYCLAKGLDPRLKESKKVYSNDKLGISTDLLPTYCSFESFCKSKKLEMYQEVKSTDKIKKLFKRK